MIHLKQFSTSQLQFQISFSQFESNAVESKGSEVLPANWNEKDFFILRYVEPSKKNLLLLKIIPSDSIILVNALLRNQSNDLINATTIDPKKLITDDYKEFDKLFQDDNSLANLVNEFKKEILDKFEPKETKKKSTTSEEQPPQRRSENPLLIPQRQPHIPMQIPMPFQPMPFPQVGGADLDPINRGFGGGMVMDPRSLEGFNPANPSFNRPRNPFEPRYDPSSGLDRSLPPGAVPPGARFEYFGPPRPRRPNPNNSNRGQNHPDLEHRPPGYDDMFM